MGNNKFNLIKTPKFYKPLQPIKSTYLQVAKVIQQIHVISSTDARPLLANLGLTPMKIDDYNIKDTPHLIRKINE